MSRGFGCRMRERLDLFRLRGLGEHIGHHGPRRTHWPSRPHWPWHKDLVRYLAAECGASINAADATVNGSTTWWCQALHSRRRHQPYLLLRIALWALLTVLLATMALGLPYGPWHVLMTHHMRFRLPSRARATTKWERPYSTICEGRRWSQPRLWFS